MAARRGDIYRVSKMIAVEIIGLARRDHRMREGGNDVVPTHVRDAQGRCGVERAHRAADPAESGVATMFFARIGEQLHPDADAEEGRALPTHALLHRFDQPVDRRQPVHACGERSEERSVRKECVSTCKTRRSPEHKQKKKKKYHHGKEETKTEK